MSTDLWGTPQNLFDKLNDEFHFTFDVCAIPANAKCSKFFQPEQDALRQEWPLGVLWMNPPYGRTIGEWLRKAWSESRQATIVALVPTRTNAPWWHEYAMRADEIRFIRKKVSFVGTKKGVAFTGHAILVFRNGFRNGPPAVSSWEQPL